MLGSASHRPRQPPPLSLSRKDRRDTVTLDDKIIAMVAIKDSTPIDPAAVAERVKTMFPWVAKSVGVPQGEPGQLDSFVIPMDNAVVPVIQIHFPIPAETLA